MRNPRERTEGGAGAGDGIPSLYHAGLVDVKRQQVIGMEPTRHTTTGTQSTARPFDGSLSRDLENIDIALSDGNPSRFERIWLKVSKRILESRIPELGGR